MKNILFIMLTGFLIAGCNEKKEEVKQCCNTKNEQKVTKDLIDQLPGTSVYQLDGDWTSHKGKPLKLNQLTGKPVVLTMIFTHCEYACPMMVNDLKMIEQEFSSQERNEFNFVLVSFDYVRDKPERLESYAVSQGLDDNWILLHGGESQVKELSVTLNISYEMLENGSFSHTNRKLVLDKQGRIVYSQNGLQTNREPVVEAIRSLL